MSPRRNRPRRGEDARGRPGRDAEREASSGGPRAQRVESHRGEDWAVRPVAGTSAKSYRCPGCEQLIPPGRGHLVAWPLSGGVDERRHWHPGCWEARDRRRADVLRSRNAPRH